MIGILTDTTKCIGCNECVIACKMINDLGPDVPRRWQKPDGLSALNWTSILSRGAGDHYIRKQCMHCKDPACVAACIVAALKATPEGPVLYDDNLCIGCRYCMLACPFGIPRYEWENTIPLIRKCTFCYEKRIRQGKQPACTEACPTEATIFGEREALLEEAKRRIKAEPSRYVDKVYGEYEAGGTAVLYISDIDLDLLSYENSVGLKGLPTTIAGAMSSTPITFFSVGAALTGIHWIISRRMKLQQPDEDSEEGANE